MENFKKLSDRITFFIGWLLSPFTFWNDAVVNIPLSYICTNIFIKIFTADFTTTLVIFYWLSNALGLIMMYCGGKSIFLERKDIVRELAVFIATVTIYSIILILLGRFGILKPV